jgi:hypothetical protein
MLDYDLVVHLSTQRY